MKIVSLELENFGKFPQAKFIFDVGLNLLVGENGAGKSTILDAIDLGLFSVSIPNREHYIRKGSNSSTIKLDLQIGEKILTLIRSWSLTDNGKSLLYDGDNCIASGMRNIQAYLSPHLGSKVYFDMYYLKQGRILDYLNLLDSAKGAIETIFGYKLRGIDGKLMSLLEEEFPFSMERHTSLLAAFNMLQTSMQSCREKINKLNSELIATNPDSITQKIEQIDKEILSIVEQQKLIQINQHILGLSSELETLETRFQECQSLFNSYQSQINHTFQSKKEVQDYISRKEEYDRLSERLAQTLDQLRAIFKSRTPLGQMPYSKNISSVSFRLDLMREMIDSDAKECNVCLSTLDDARKAYLKQSLQKFKTLNEIIIKRRKDRQLVRSLVSSIRDLEHRLKDLGDISSISLEQLRTLLTCIEKLEQIDSRRKFIEGELEKLYKIAKPVVSSKGDVGQLQAERKRLCDELIAFQSKKQLLDEANQQLEKFQENVKSCELDLNRSKTEAKFHEWSYSTIEEIIQSIRTACRIFLENRILPKVNETLRELNTNYTLFLDPDGVFLANTNYIYLPLSRLSYGQRILLCMVFILNFLLETKAGNILLADEPTAGLDAQKLQSLADLLAKLHLICVGHQLQLIWATHEFSFLGGIGRCLEVS